MGEIYQQKTKETRLNDSIMDEMITATNDT